MPDSTKTNNPICMAVAVPESQRSMLVDALKHCTCFEVISALIPERGLAREWRGALRCRKSAASLGEIVDDPEAEAVLLTDPRRLNLHSIEAALQAGKHVLMTSGAADALEQFDRLGDISAITNGKVLTLMPWRFDPNLQGIKQRLEDGDFGKNPQATFRCYIDPRVNQNSREMFIRAAIPEFAIANWLFGPANAISADVDFALSRPGAVIATHANATVVHHFSAGNLRASLRVQGNQSECKAEAHMGGWNSLIQDSPGAMNRSGSRPNINPHETKPEHCGPLASQLNEFSGHWGDAEFVKENNLASRGALEAALASLMASKEGTKVTLPMSRAQTSAQDAGHADETRLPAAVSK